MAVFDQETTATRYVAYSPIIRFQCASTSTVVRIRTQYYSQSQWATMSCVCSCLWVWLCFIAFILFSRLSHFFTRTHFLSAWEDRTVHLNHPPDGFRCIFGVITTCDALCSCFPFSPFTPSPFHQIHPFHPLTFIFFFLPSKSALLMVQDSKIVMLHPTSLPLEHRVPI